MKKVMESKTESDRDLLPEYGKIKLLTYAESFRDLANTFAYIYEKETNSEQKTFDGKEAVWRRRFLESKELVVDHLNEVAQIMVSVAEQSFDSIPNENKIQKQIESIFKAQNIHLKSFYIVQNEEKHLQIGLTMKSTCEEAIMTEEVAYMLSDICKRKIVPVKNTIDVIWNRYEAVTFEEDVTYRIAAGAAKAVKQQEIISGDNYTFARLENGKFIAALSDGMGSGEKAYKDSETVIELLEKFLEVGYSKETTIQMINGVLLAGGEEKNVSTLDICDINLYNGICEFLKIGSAVTYIKRGSDVEHIISASLPLGVFYQIDAELTTRKLKHGDCIIIVSDGVTDMLSSSSGIAGELILADIIAKLPLENPKDLANKVLQLVIHKGQGKIIDDMTVLVIELWENKV